jgi:hypothetical protein
VLRNGLARILSMLQRIFIAAQRPILARRHASDTVSSRSPRETCRAYLRVFWRRNAGWTTSGQYFADDHSPKLSPQYRPGAN